MVLSKQTLLVLSSLLYAATAATVPKVPEAPEGLIVLAQESVDDGAGVLTLSVTESPLKFTAALTRTQLR
jgi:hypothetical protein